jgi:hypothetical protein
MLANNPPSQDTEAQASSSGAGTLSLCAGQLAELREGVEFKFQLDAVGDCLEADDYVVDFP